jgi:hypothetical protein
LSGDACHGVQNESYCTANERAGALEGGKRKASTQRKGVIGGMGFVEFKVLSVCSVPALRLFLSSSIMFQG